MPPSPHIACIDLDCFFVSVERLLDPSLVGRPVIVGHRGGRGVVTSCSYEVRPRGVRSGMPMARALRLAPDAVVVHSGFAHYAEHARRVWALVGEVCPEVCPASVDEAYLDFTGCARLYRRPGDLSDHAAIERVVRALRDRIQVELGLPASVGVGATRAVAKMASARAKPAGVCAVRPGEERAFVDLLPVRAWPGIGPVTGAKLDAAGIHTLGQLLDLPRGPLAARFGRLRDRVARGLDGARAPARRRTRPAFREHDPEGAADGSLSNERTFRADLSDDRAVDRHLAALVERVCWRARKRGVRARTIGLKLRFADFHTLTRSRTRSPTCDEAVVLEVVRALYRRARGERALPVRLVGVRLTHLERPAPQLALPFHAPAPGVDRAIDDVRRRFGYDAIRLGATPTAGARWRA